MRNISFLKIIFTLYVSCIASVQLYAVNIVRHISNINGLTNNSINCIFEDSEHTMWIGTWDGLNSFNGRDIQTFKYSKNDPNSISNNIIRQIIEYKKHLWIATDNGINKLDKRTHHITRYYLQGSNKIPNQEKSFIIRKTAKNEMICLVKGVGLFLYNDHTNNFIPMHISYAGQIKDFYISYTNHLLFLFNDDHIKCSNNEQFYHNIKPYSLQTIKSRINKIFLSGNRLILSNSDYIYLLNNDFSTTYVIKLNTHKTVSDITLAGNRMYISFIEGGCINYNLNKKSFTYLHEISDQTSIFTLYYGSQHILWIGTDGQGLIQIYPYEPLFQTVYSTHPVRNFCENKNGDILVATKGDGVKLLNRKDNRLSNYLNEKNGLISNSVYALKINSSNDIFIGTEGRGINILYARTGKLERLTIPKKYPPFQAVYGINFTNHDSLIWIGTSGYGLIKINLIKKRGQYVVTGFRQYKSTDKNNLLNNDVVYSITSDSQNHPVWFGTRGGGLNEIDIRNNHIRTLEEIGNVMLTNNDVLCLMPDKDNLWIGTSYGLNKLIKNGNHYRLIQFTNRLVNKTIHGILKDRNGNIWISTNKGLSVIKKGIYNIENFTFNDGLQNNEFSDGAYFKDRQNTLYFGGVSGFNFFNPQKMHVRQFSPNIMLSNLKIYNSVQPISEKIHDNILNLSYNERFVTFTFISKDFINNENCEYAYRLKNLSEEWINNGNNPNITLTQFAPGKYKLEVKCTNGDKVLGNHIYELTIHVGYPWWLSLPAFLIYGIIGIIISLIVKSVIVNRIKLSRQVLIAQIEKTHEKKIYETKLNFFNNVAHEFFTPLTLIYTPIQYLIEHSKGNDNSQKYLQIIQDNAERMQKLITELLKFRNAKSEIESLHPSAVDMHKLVNEACNNFLHVLKENKIDFNVDEQNLTSLYSDQNALDKVLFNLISNAFKYTPRNGYIRIKAWQDTSNPNTFNFVIRNSGKGLTQQQIIEIFDKYKMFDTPNLGNSSSHGIGLNITKNIVEQMDGHIKAESELGKYVEFSLQIPPFKQAIITKIGNEDIPDKINQEHLSQEIKADTTVLIVEDENDIRKIIKDVLSNYNIREATDGFEAINEIHKNHPNIIITDMVMPNMSGIELIDKLKSDPKTGYIPIVALSGKISMEDQINAFNHGADAYITKPFYPRQITSTIENLLSRQALLKDYFNSSYSSMKLKDGITLHAEDEDSIQKIFDFIKSNIDDESLTPISIAEYVGISKATLYRKFNDITGKTPTEFIRNIRLEYAAKLLKTTKLTVSEIMYKVGFSSKSCFYREFSKQYGETPKDYRKTNP